LSRLPVIVGFGGINPAGRVSFHHAYRRLVIDALDEARQERTFASLSQIMGLSADNPDAATDPELRQYMLDHTLLRRIESFDPRAIPWQRAAKLNAEELKFVITRRQLPEQLPPNWQVRGIDERNIEVTVTESLNALLPDSRVSRVSSAGQLPTGFAPDTLYQSRNHPRGLQLTVYGASDAINSTGFSIEELKAAVRPDEIAVYSGSAMGQLDEHGYGGLMHAELKGKRVTSKQIALGLPEMCTDFINAYVLGSVGGSAGIIGACATFLYNVKQGVDDIRSGKRRIVVVGNAEAPILPDLIEGYRTMGALAEDEALMALDDSDTPDHRRACRPFAENCGFTLAEAANYFVLMDDELALSMGARILGGVADVFVNADGYKKSIPGPGIGNYLTVAKAMGSVRSILGEESLKKRSYVQAHGTGTPQNRVTESHILNELAKTFGIEGWMVGAVKAYLGHTIAPAGGDQLAAALGAWHDGLVPGITSIEDIAEDVHKSNLDFPIEHREIDPDAFDSVLLNSKGFGGNNATGIALSPKVTRDMLIRRHGKKALKAHAKQNEAIEEKALAYDNAMISEGVPPTYQFGKGVIQGEELTLSEHAISIPGFPNEVSLDIENPYPDMADDSGS